MISHILLFVSVTSVFLITNRGLNFRFDLYYVDWSCCVSSSSSSSFFLQCIFTQWTKISILQTVKSDCHQGELSYLSFPGHHQAVLS